VNIVHDQTTKYDVEAVTLGTLLKRVGVETVDILKLDLEGAEYDVLKRITADELRPFKQVFVEFHHHAVGHIRKADTERLVKLISGCGFRAFSLDDHNYLFHRGR
jgi:methyltransferase FkbM-like protein